MQRNSQSYLEMIAEQQLVDKWISYLKAVEATHGPGIFFACLENKQDGRLFGNLTSKALNDDTAAVKTSLSDFYPEQKKIGGDGREKIIQVDMLGEEISASIIERLDSGESMYSIGAFIAETLNKDPRFQDFIDQIAASTEVTNEQTKQKVSNFILGQLVFFSLLPVLQSGIHKLNEEVIKPSMDVQKDCRREMAAESSTEQRIEELKLLIKEQDKVQAPAEKVMREMTQKMGKMKSMFSTAGAYNHNKEIKRARAKEGAPATLGDSVAEHWSQDNKGRKPARTKSGPDRIETTSGSNPLRRLFLRDKNKSVEVQAEEFSNRQKGPDETKIVMGETVSVKKMTAEEYKAKLASIKGEMPKDQDDNSPRMNKK